MQKLVTNASRLPTNPLLSAFADASANLNLSLQTSKRELKKRIKELSWLQKQMFKVAETNISLKYPIEELKQSEDIATEDLWNKLNQNFNQSLPFVEQTIDRWNNQTQILGNLKKTDKSHFSQSIVT
jgi:hypothetical protein